MRKAIGWLGLLVAALIGIAATFGTLYVFAPAAPSFWLLILVPLAIGAAVAAALARPLASRIGIARATAARLAGLVAILPLGGLVSAMLLSPEQPRASAAPDPRGPHRTLRTSAGSVIAWWSIGPSKTTHRTPVVFLHGGPGTFTRNRDFEVAQGFRDAGFQTVFYDQSGSGTSGDLRIERYTVANAVADLDSLRGAIGADRIVLWGQSWGASLAAAYTSAHPDRVAAIVLDSPGDFPGEPHPLDYSNTDMDGGFQPTLRDATLYLLIGNAPQLAEDWQNQADARATQQARTNKIRYIYGFQCKNAKTKLKRPPSPGGGNLYPQLRLQSDLERQPNVTKALSKAPAMLIRGTCDYIPPATAERYMRAFPAAERIDVPGRGHALYGHDNELSAILNRFASTSLASLP